jgi:hypothetical protein
VYTHAAVPEFFGWRSRSGLAAAADVRTVFPRTFWNARDPEPGG